MRSLLLDPHGYGISVYSLVRGRVRVRVKVRVRVGITGWELGLGFGVWVKG